jgi:hypothetical protein
MHYPGKQEHGKVEAVRPIEIMDPQRFHPENSLYELQTSKCPIVRTIDIDRERQSDPGEDETHPFDQALSLARYK